MSSLAALEVLTGDMAFLPETPQPASPGKERSFVESSRRRPARLNEGDDLWSEVDESLRLTLERALRLAEQHRSATTLSALAQSFEATTDTQMAVDTAVDAMSMLRVSETEQLDDPLAARVAVEVMLRAGEFERVLDYSRTLPLSATTKVMIASALAASGRVGEAHELLDPIPSPGSDAVLGYVLLVEGRYREAVRKLRRAVHMAPDDANSAHNLSIAFFKLGSRRKALLSAMQARSSAPGREDISLHYFEMLLSEGEHDRVDGEIAKLISSGVVASSRLYITQARARLGSAGFSRAESLLERARNRAKDEGDLSTLVEVQSNLVRLRAANGKLERKLAVEELVDLNAAHPQNLATVINLAQATFLKSHAFFLRRAIDVFNQPISESRRAFIEYQLATLEGDVDSAAEKALEWLRLEPRSAEASSAALIALGIGCERWDEAAALAHDLLRFGARDASEVNNLAYVLSMSGAPDRAIEILEPIVGSDFVLKATLGLSFLASGNLAEGMKLYREAARQAEKQRGDSYCLMAFYQALVVRQLGILDRADASVVAALALSPVEMPSDWEDRPEFLRLHAVSTRNGFPWPLEL